MATSSPPSNNSMRQQLDELDALLQRMLSLPVNQTDDTLPDPAMRRPAATELTTAAEANRRPPMTLLEGSAPVAAPQSPPANWDQHCNINLNPQNGSSVFGTRSPTAQRTMSPAAPPIFRAETVAYTPPQAEPTPQPPMSAPSPMPASIPPLTPPRQTRPETPALPLLPLVGLNRAFDGVVSVFGPPGQWLCTQTGRNLLGLAGLAMLFGSIAYGASHWFGWLR